MNVVAEIGRINEAELKSGVVGTSASWHAKYANSAWVYAGNLPRELSEGDVICILSQYGEIEDINLSRDEETGKSRGFAFVKYEDARSCVLAVDNLTGTKVLGRTLRVDHVEKYRLPKHLMEKEDQEEEGQRRTDPGRMYEDKELTNQYNIHHGQDLFAPVSATTTTATSQDRPKLHKGKDNEDDNDRKEAKRKRKEKRQQRRRERDVRRQHREERRRERRAKRYREESPSRGDDDDELDDDQKRRKQRRKRNKRDVS